MYTFSNKLKTFAIALIVIGLLGMVVGYINTPKDIHAVEEILKSHKEHGSENAHAVKAEEHDSHGTDKAHTEVNSHHEHLEHVLHQYQNKPWSAFFIAAFFFLMVTVFVLAFYAIQWAAEVGWSIVLFRVMEAITAYILPGSILLYVFLLASGFHMNHLYSWMGVEAKSDEILQGKKWWLNEVGWIIRATIYLGGYILFRYLLRKNAAKLDEKGDYKTYMKSKNLAVGFIVFLAVSMLFLGFDWLMSLDPHWYSQLYSFYVLASLLVTAITTIALITIYLKSKGYLPNVNHNHLHDLGKFMFGFSIFWTYFWFDQFMLQWYSNQPEEVVYFVPRLLGSYQIIFISMLFLNFVFPILILISSDFKRLNWVIVMAGISIIIGHFIDIYILISPATVGDVFSFGFSEIGSVLFILGIFIFVVFRALAKYGTEVKYNPYLHESEHHHV